MHWTLWILWLADFYRQSGLWHNECPAVVLVDLWLAAGWQHVFSHQPQVWTLRTPCSWNSMWWWPTTRNKSLQRSAFKRGRWSMSLKRVRVVSNQMKCTANTCWAGIEQRACCVYIWHKQKISQFSPYFLKHTAPLSISTLPPLLSTSLLAVTYPHLEAHFGLKSALFFPTVGLGWRPEYCL